MRKFSYIALCTLFGVMGVSSVQASSDGVINFDGEIIAGGCDVVPGSDSQTVSMGTMSAKSFKGAGTTVGSAQFNIELTNCHPSLTSVGLVFDGVPHADDPTILALLGAESAEGVGIALYEVDGTTLIPLRTRGQSNILDGETSTTLRYVAKYKSTSETVTAGKASTVVNFTLVYN